jgi:thioredoxin 2
MGALLQIPCAKCLATNRVPQARMSDTPVCGRCKSQLLPDHPVALTDESFDAFVGASELPVIVDFWASWCGPCLRMAPEFQAASKTLAGKALFAKLDTEAAPHTARRFGIRSIPTMIAFRKGQEAARQSGLMSSAQIQKWVVGTPG